MVLVFLNIPPHIWQKCEFLRNILCHLLHFGFKYTTYINICMYIYSASLFKPQRGRVLKNCICACAPYSLWCIILFPFPFHGQNCFCRVLSCFIGCFQAIDTYFKCCSQVMTIPFHRSCRVLVWVWVVFCHKNNLVVIFH